MVQESGDTLVEGLTDFGEATTGSLFNDACEGGDVRFTLNFMAAFGYTWVSCYPYASGGGDPSVRL